MLAEAVETERINVESLNAIRKWEEDEKARRKVKGPILTGPRVVYRSVGSRTVLTFRDCDDVGVLPVCLRSLVGKTSQHVGKAKLGHGQPDPAQFAVRLTCIFYLCLFHY
jgi:hypothetical protein